MRPSKNNVKPISRLWPLPEGMAGCAAEFWTRAGRELVKAGLLTDLDKESFIAMCSSYHLMMGALVEIEKDGINVQGSRDPLKKNPAWTSYKSASDVFLRFAKEFAILPGARNNFDLIFNGNDELENFLRRKNND